MRTVHSNVRHPQGPQGQLLAHPAPKMKAWPEELGHLHQHLDISIPLAEEDIEALAHGPHSYGQQWIE